MKQDEHLPTNPDLEARVVAWVLGEASPFEIAELERAITEHPELGVFKRRIEAVHGLVGQASRPVAKSLRISAEKRAKLLATIGGPDAAGRGAPEATSATTAEAGVIEVYPQQQRRTRIPLWLFSAAACVLVGVFAVYEMKQRESEVRVAEMRSDDREFVVAKAMVASDEKRKQERALAEEYKQRSAEPQVLKVDGGVRPDPMPTSMPSAAAASPATSYVGQMPSGDLSLEGAVPRSRAATSPVVVPDSAALPPVQPTTPSSEQTLQGLTMSSVSEPDAIVKLPSFVVAAERDVLAAGALANNSKVSIEPRKFNLFSEQSFSASQSSRTDLDRRFDGRIGSPYTSDVIYSDRLADSAPFTFSTGGKTEVSSLSIGSGGGLAPTVSPNEKANLVATDTGNQLAQIGGTAYYAVARSGSTWGGLPSSNVAQTQYGGKGSGPVVLGEYADVTVPANQPAPQQVASASGSADPEGVVKLDSFEVRTEKDRGFWPFRRKKAAAKEDPKVTATVASASTPAALRESAGKLTLQAAAVAKNSTDTDPPVLHPAAAIDEMLRLETPTQVEATSTFSLHVSDVSFRLAQAALEHGQLPDAAAIRPEEFYNAFDYGDPAAVAGEPVACRLEQAAHPFLQQRNLVRIGMKVPANGRGVGQPLNLTVLLDTSGSMEREDRVATVRRAFGVLASLLGPNDRITLIGFARQPHLLADRLPGNEAAKLVEILGGIPADGGTNLEEALKLATKQATAQFAAGAQNRIVVLTDGAANLGNDNPTQLAALVDALRQQGIAFDACGVGIAGLDDSVLEALTRKGDGRYYVINSPEEADAGFAQKLAGAFRPAAENVKVQVRFNPARVRSYRLIGFEQHRLRNEDFRNDKVDAAELAAEEGAVALYQVEVNPDGEGELGDVYVRFRSPGSHAMIERSWTLSYLTRPPAFDQATPSLQLAGAAAMLAEKLRGGGPAIQIRLSDLAPTINRLRSTYSSQPRVQQFVQMYEEARRRVSD